MEKSSLIMIINNQKNIVETIRSYKVKDIKLTVKYEITITKK